MRNHTRRGRLQATRTGMSEQNKRRHHCAAFHHRTTVHDLHVVTNLLGHALIMCDENHTWATLNRFPALRFAAF